MAEAILPEEIIVLILCWLPVKSLLRFACVSKRFHSIILSDPKFAKSQFEAARDRKTITRKLLCSVEGPRFESIDLETPSFGDHSSVINLKFPFPPPDTTEVTLAMVLCFLLLVTEYSIRGTLQLVSSRNYLTRVFPHFSITSSVMVLAICRPPMTTEYWYSLSTMMTDDYDDEAAEDEAAIFSSRANAWKTLEEADVEVLANTTSQGTLLKEALHWLDGKEIVAFDLAQEEECKFRKMLLPQFDDHDYNFWHLGVSAGEYLSLARFFKAAADCIHVWIMREYDVRDSWTKLFSLKFSDPPAIEPWSYHLGCELVQETSFVTQIHFKDGYDHRSKWVKITQEEDQCSFNKIEGSYLEMTQYQESLLRVDD